MTEEVEDEELSDEQMVHMVTEQFHGLLLLEIRDGIASREKLRRVLKHPSTLKADLHKCIALIGENMPGQPRTKRKKP